MISTAHLTLSGELKMTKSQYKHFKITICNYISQQDIEITLNITKSDAVQVLGNNSKTVNNIKNLT
jgi:predicted RNA-binding protein YlqC (UPF0109 family)